MASLRVDSLLAKTNDSSSLLDLARMLDLEIPEALAGLLREPTKLGVNLAQPIHIFVESEGDANATNPNFLCVSADIADASALSGQINFFTFLGMKKNTEGNLTICHFAQSSLAFAFDDRHFALALGLSKGIETEVALAKIRSLFTNLSEPNSILENHLAKPFDLGFYLRPEGVAMAPELLSKWIDGQTPSAISTTRIEFKAGEIITRFNSFATDSSALPARSDLTQVNAPENAIATLALSFEDHTPMPLANFAFQDFLHSLWSVPFSFPEDNASSPEKGRLVATWSGSSQAKDGTYVAEMSIPGQKQGDSEAVESASWNVANPQLTGIQFSADVNCRKAVVALRSIPKPEAWRYDLVNTFEKLERLTWSGNLFESVLTIGWRDAEKNSLVSLLNLIRKWQRERDGAELYAAIAADDFAALKDAMENSSPDLLDPERGVSPLHFAAWQGRARMLQYFIDKGIDVDTPDASGRTPLYAACWSGKEETVRALLDQKAIVDFPNANGATPVMGAARIGHAGIVEILLNAGANLNATDKHGHGILEYAAAGGRDEIVDLLNERNATVRRPLHLAAGSGDHNGLQQLLQSGRAVDEKDGWGGTALLFAASAGKLNTLDALLDKGANPAITDNLGLTLIHAATVSGNEKVLQRVLDLNPEINPRHKQHGSTPLDWAIAKQDKVLTEMLRAKGGKTSWELGTP